LIGQTPNAAQFRRVRPNDVREKSYNFFYTLRYFGAPAVLLGQSSPMLALMCNKPSINLSNFVPFWQPVYEISVAAKFHRFRWRRDRQQTVNDVSAYHAVNEW